MTEVGSGCDRWQAPDGFAPLDGVETTTTPGGRRIYYDPQDSRGRTLARLGGEVYPRSVALWKLALGLRDRWDLVVDVGANYGEMLVAPDRLSTDRVVAFEPNPRVARCLRMTAAELPWTTEVVEMAVSDRSADGATLQVDERWSGRSRLVEDAVRAVESPDDARIVIRQTSLSDHFGPDAVRDVCVKIDVEGFEERVLDGAEELFRSVDRGVVMIEILHLAVSDLHALAQRWPLYLLAEGDARLVRWAGGDVSELGRLLYSGKILYQDALLVVGRMAEELDGEIQASPITRERTAIYTVAGLGDTLLDHPAPAPGSGIDMVCLTLDPDLESDAWDVRLVKLDGTLPDRRALRHLRVVGDELLSEFDRTVYVDPDASLPEPVEALIEAGRRQGSDIVTVELSTNDGAIAEVAAGVDAVNHVQSRLIGMAVADRAGSTTGARTTTLHIDRRSPGLGVHLALWSACEDRIARIMGNLSASRRALADAEKMIGKVRRAVGDTEE